MAAAGKSRPAQRSQPATPAEAAALSVDMVSTPVGPIIYERHEGCSIPGSITRIPAAGCGLFFGHSAAYSSSRGGDVSD